MVPMSSFVRVTKCEEGHCPFRTRQAGSIKDGELPWRPFCQLESKYIENTFPLFPEWCRIKPKESKPTSVKDKKPPLVIG